MAQSILFYFIISLQAAAALFAELQESYTRDAEVQQFQAPLVFTPCLFLPTVKTPSLPTRGKWNCAGSTWLSVPGT